jgi:hypothetical protein
MSEAASVAVEAAEHADDSDGEEAALEAMLEAADAGTIMLHTRSL